MAHPWNYGPVVFDWEDAGATAAIVELDVPARGVIKQLHYQELDGAGTEGTIYIYNSEAAANEAVNFANGSSASASSSAALAAPFSMSEITGGGIPYNGGTLIQAGATFELPYRNRDGNYSNPVRRLWMVIDVTTGTPTDFSVALVIDLPDMSS